MKHVRKLTKTKILEATAAIDFVNAVLNGYYDVVFGKKNFIIGGGGIVDPPDDGGDGGGDTGGDDEERLFF
ncbi:MAG: hypothetical protein AMXMBFR84_38340 [Candidatus Hydrogenedentota bacterium]